MKIIVGLGNPGENYTQTRHNVGFLVVDELARAHAATWTKKQAWQAHVCDIELGDERTLLVKPQTYMNMSGRSVASVLSNTPATREALTVVYDDADLNFGRIQQKASGSAAGQRGMQSIIDTLGTSDIARIRIGIGRPHNPHIPLEDWVLGTWTDDESDQLAAIIEEAIGYLSTSS